MQGLAPSQPRDEATIIRQTILEMARAMEAEVPGFSTIAFRRICAVNHYMGPVEAVLGQMREEGLVTSWTPGRMGMVYMNSVRLRDLFPELPPLGGVTRGEVGGETVQPQEGRTAEDEGDAAEEGIAFGRDGLPGDF